VPHAGICAGGRSKERSLPRSLLLRRASNLTDIGASRNAPNILHCAIRYALSSLTSPMRRLFRIITTTTPKNKGPAIIQIMIPR